MGEQSSGHSGHSGWYYGIRWLSSVVTQGSHCLFSAADQFYLCHPPVTSFIVYTVTVFSDILDNEVLISHYYDSVKNIISFVVMNINPDI